MSLSLVTTISLGIHFLTLTDWDYEVVYTIALLLYKLHFLYVTPRRNIPYAATVILNILLYVGRKTTYSRKHGVFNNIDTQKNATLKTSLLAISLNVALVTV